MFDPVLENKSGSGPSSIRKLDGVPWSIGLVEPLDLLTYRPFDAAPEHCRTPERLFAEVRASVNGSDTHCSATTQPPLAGTAGMHLTCHFAAQARCDHRYEALLWAERMGAGTVEYVVRGFSWASRSCPDGAYVAPKEVHDAAESVSQRWEELARRCDARAAR